MNLLDLYEQREPYQLAIDKLEGRRIDDLNTKMSELLARAKEPAYKKDPKALAALKREFDKIKAERDSYYKINLDEVDPTKTQSPAKGLLKGKDLVTPQQRVAGATPSKPGVMGAVKDVVGGIKRFVKGEPDQGPTFEQQEGLSPRALGVANFQRIAKANAGFQPTVNLEFIRPEENFKLDQRGLDLISDYYDGLADDQAKNYFIYRVLPSGDETLKVLKQLGWTPSTPVQQELPNIPTQGELPLSERQNQKKKSDDLAAGDIKVARELQKIRAQYPAARSDIEALARAEIDSSERSQQQIGNIRSANTKQDELLKQIMDLDRAQSREISNIDNENDSLEQQLNRVQSLNDKLAQSLAQMPGAKSSRPSARTTATTGAIDLIPGAPADKGASAPATTDTEPKKTPGTSPAMAAMAQQIQGLSKPAPTIRPAPGLKSANDAIEQEKVAEHGGGIGPRQHWQDLMRNESWSDKYGGVTRPPTPYGVYIDGRQWKVFPTDDHARAVAEKVRANLKRQGRNQTVTIGPSQEWLKGNDIKEAKEIASKEDFIRERDRLLRMISQETNPANKQILKSSIRQLENRAENEGWISIQNRMVREQSSTSSEAAERAILNRIMVAHTDLLKQYGPQKVMQAAEEVAYNVGDLDEIGTSDVSGWVRQVEQILGARP